MKKSLIILILIILLIGIFVFYFVINYRNMQLEVQINNREYNTYYEKSVVGTTLVSLINKTIDKNERNNIDKDTQNAYIENEENSIKIYIYFLNEDGERTERYTMEQIYNNGTQDFIRLYGTSYFVCTNIEYHEKTGNVKSLTFEQQIY